MNVRPALTWLAIWTLIATATAAGIVVGGLILGTLSPVAASREAERADLPILPGRMTTEPSLPSPDSTRLRETPTAAPPATTVPSPVAAPSPSASATPVARKGTSETAPSPSAAVPSRPTATTHRVAGKATWFCLPGRSACTRDHPASGLYAAAGPALRSALGPGWRGTVVTVTANGVSVSAQLVDTCACPGGRVVDLYASAFEELAPLSRGVVPVTVSWK